jgi:hypothetical protein
MSSLMISIGTGPGEHRFDDSYDNPRNGVARSATESLGDPRLLGRDDCRAVCLLSER